MELIQRKGIGCCRKYVIGHSVCEILLFKKISVQLLARYKLLNWEKKKTQVCSL